MEVDAKEYTKQLMDRAMAGKHSEFTYLRSNQELYAAINVWLATKDISHRFKKGSTEQFDNYLIKLNTTPLDPQNVVLLVSTKAMLQCSEFYKREAEILKESISEYKAFLKSNNFTRMLFGGYREDNELYRHDLITIEVKF